MKADWELAEDDFDNHWKRMGKRAHLFEFKDARALRGMNKRPTAVGKQPSDRLVTFDGVTFFAEVKFTTDPRGFNFNLIKPGQWGTAIMVTAAGGDYRIYIKSAVTGDWYCLPFSVIQGWPARSMTWSDLLFYKVKI